MKSYVGWVFAARLEANLELLETVVSIKQLMYSPSRYPAVPLIVHHWDLIGLLATRYLLVSGCVCALDASVSSFCATMRWTSRVKLRERPSSMHANGANM